MPNQDTRKQRSEQGLCRQCGKVPPAEGKTWCDACRIKETRHTKNWRDRNRLSVLEHYSHGTIECSCCHEKDVRFLTIDHINGGGTKHHNSLSSGGNYFYKIPKDQGYPEGYQVLCWNCNCARRQYGVCPHKL